MPISFILSGIFLLLSFFYRKNLRNFSIFFCVMFSAFFIMLSYFWGDMYLNDFSLNVFSCMSLFILLFYIFSKKFSSLYDVVFIVFCSLLYYFIISSDTNFLMSYNLHFSYLFIFVFCIVFISSFNRGIGFVTLLSVMMCVFNAIVEIDSCGYYPIIDFRFCVDSIWLYVLTHLIYFYVVSLKKLFWRRFYVKKDFVCSDVIVIS
jgi:hypothetical protein